MANRLLGIGAVMANLVNIQTRATSAAKRKMERIARDVAADARDYAPIDEGDLEGAIVVAEDKTFAATGRSRTRYTVGVDESRDVNRGDGRLGIYAVEMHEGSYELGPRSREKAARGKAVGPKYLERALDKHAGRVGKDIAATLSEEIGE